MLQLSDQLHLVVSVFVSQAIRVGTSVALAHLISREEYGLYLLILAVPALVSLNDLGLATSWIQLQDRSALARDTAVLLGLSLYSFYGLIYTATAGYFAITRADPRLWLVGLILTVTGLLQMLYTLQLAELNQTLQFRSEAKQNLLFAVFQGAAGISLAAFGFGIYALALQGLVAQVVANAVISRRSPCRCPRSFSPLIARRFVSLGGKVGIAAYLENVIASAIGLTVNRIGGHGALADWGRAIQVQALVNQNVWTSFERVVYPVLCRTISDPGRLRALLTNATLSLLLIASFGSAWLYSLRTELTELGLGAQWVGVPALLAIVALAGPASALYSISYQACYALGRTSVLLRSSVLYAVLILPMLGLVLVQGLAVEVIACIWVGSRIVIALINFGWVAKAVQLPLRALVGPGAGLLGAGLLSGVLMAYCRTIVPTATPIFVRFVLCSVLGLLAHGLLVWMTQPGIVSFLWRMCRRGKSSQGPAPPGEMQAALSAGV